jgi:penicillin G amidase
MVVTANQRVVGPNYPEFLSHVWAAPYRARRIFDLLSAKPKVTGDDFRRIQGDIYSIGNVTFAHAAARTLKAVSEPGAVAAGSFSQLATDLENWDGMMAADSKTAVLVAQMRSAFRQRILNAALGPDLARNYAWPESDVLIDRIATEHPRDWLPKEFSTYADLFRAAYEDARQVLTKSLGDESKWTWGNQTKSRFPHPLAQAPLIGVQFTIQPFPQNGAGGSGATVNVGAAVSMRLIADPSDWDKTLNGIPLGESGLPNSSHWKDQLDDWRNVSPRVFPFSKAAVESATREMLVLTPK